MLMITEKPGLLYKNHQIFDELWLKYKLSSAPDLFLINDTCYNLKNQGRNLKKRGCRFRDILKINKNIWSLHAHRNQVFLVFQISPEIRFFSLKSRTPRTVI